APPGASRAVLARFATEYAVWCEQQHGVGGPGAPRLDRLPLPAPSEASSSAVSVASEEDDFEERVAAMVAARRRDLDGGSAACEVSDSLDLVEDPAFLLQGAQSLHVWRSAGVGTDPSARIAFRSSWQQNVVAKLTGRDREQAAQLIGKILIVLRNPHSPDIDRLILQDVIYATCAAAFGPHRAAGIVRSYRADVMHPDLRRRVRLEAALEHESGSNPVVRDAYRKAGGQVPTEGEIASARLAAETRPDSGKAPPPRRRGRGGAQRAPQPPGAPRK
ncbi:MAG TPA: hypothetical protein VM490_19840, partial [Armatimonadaceae bacterium]|nr:hypothetical protein [Armatimonadaceae bacterium]